MRTNISFSWAGKTDAEDGVATFGVGLIKVTVPMASFKGAKGISDLLLDAYKNGHEDGVWNVSALVNTALDNAANDYSNTY